MRRLFVRGLLGLSAAWVAWYLSHPVSVLLSEPQTVVASQMRQVDGSAISGLLIAGWVEENRVLPSGRLKAWYRIANVGVEPIQDLKLSLHGSGFGPSTLSGCGAPGGMIPTAGAAALTELKPGTSCTLTAETGATAKAGEYMLTAGFSWTGPQRATQFETVELGPVRVRSQQSERVAGLLGLLVQMTPFFIPVLVALLGFWFQQRQQKFVQERQAWATMVPVNHVNNSSCYLPLLSAIRSLRTNLSTSEGFFYLLLTIRLMRNVNSGSGFFLKDRKGEDLATDLWSAFLKTLRAPGAFDPIESLQAAVDAVQPGDSFSRFRRKLKRLTTLEGTFPGLEKSFKSWCLKEGGNTLLLFYRVLHHEMNRNYFYWYGSKDFLELDFVRELRTCVDGSNLEGPLRKRMTMWIDCSRSWRSWWYELKVRGKSQAAHETAYEPNGTAPPVEVQEAAVEPKQENLETATEGPPERPKPKGEG